MPHRVFISYANENIEFADRAYSSLKNAGVTCWMAPHDIAPAESWIKAIMEAVKTCDVMVLILCAHANQSKHVVAEANQAFHHNKKILTVRVNDLPPCDELAYFLATQQWLETHRLSTEAAIRRIVDAVKALVESPTSTVETPALEDPLDVMPLADLVNEGIELVNEEIGHLTAMDKRPSPKEITRILDTAIHYGAPAYNRGSIIGCAEIYLTACQGLCNVLRTASIPANVSWGSPFERFVSKLKTIESSHPQTEKATANPLAWALRHIFDGFHAALGIQEVQEVMSQIASAHLPICRDVVLIPIAISIQHGNRVFEAEDWVGCAELHHYTAERIRQFLEGAASKSSLRRDPELFVFHQDLKDILKKYPKVEPATAQALAWDLYTVFEQMLKTAGA